MRSLRSIILVNFGFLTAAALLLVGFSAVVLADIDREAALPFVLAYSVGALLVFLGFGAWLVRRMMLHPLAVLAQTADALAEGGATVPAPPYEVREFQALDERFRAMAARLLDAQGQVVRAEKLAAIGRLGAGLAHEIRNPLGALNTYVEVLKQRGIDGELIDAMQKEVARMDHIVAGLLDYARPRHSARTPADLVAAARSTLDFLNKQGALKGHGVELVADPDVPLIGADPHDLEQILEPDPQCPRRPSRRPDRHRDPSTSPRREAAPFGRARHRLDAATEGPPHAAAPLGAGGPRRDAPHRRRRRGWGGRGGPRTDLRSLLQHQAAG